MNIPLTTQLLGELIEKGYGYMLVSVSLKSLDDEVVPVILMPVKDKPVLNNLPEGYETFYKITREPMQLACGVDGTTIMVDYGETNEDITSEDLFDDSYFRMSEDFFRQVLDSLDDYAVFTTNKNGNVNSWNSGAEKVLGYTEAEILGLNAKIFFTPEDIARNEHNKELENAIKNGRAIDERYHVRNDGSRFWGSGLVFPLFDEEHKHRGFTKVMRNLREREAAEEQAST